MTKQEKVQAIKEALLAGVPKRKIDKKGRGYSAYRLLSGKGNTDKKIDEMYENLIIFRNNGVGVKSQAVAQEEPALVQSNSQEGLEKRVKDQEIEIAGLKKRLESLEKAAQKQEEKKKKPAKKILGVPITQKTDIVGGRKYVRWYGYKQQNGKRRWIYIGKDFSQAFPKISAFLEKEAQHDSQTTSPVL